MPTPPDCEATASPPGGGTMRVKVALRRMPGSLLITPRQLGPTSRMLRRPGDGEQLALPLRTLRAELAEARGDDDRGADTGVRRVASGIDDAVAGTATTARSTGTSTGRGRRRGHRRPRDASGARHAPSR